MARLASKKFIDIVEEDWGYRKSIKSEWKTLCDMCDGVIEKGDNFVFVNQEGSAMKLCVDCLSHVLDFLGRLKYKEENEI